MLSSTASLASGSRPYSSGANARLPLRSKMIRSVSFAAGVRSRDNIVDQIAPMGEPRCPLATRTA
jgi:hypothetical protein